MERSGNKYPGKIKAGILVGGAAIGAFFGSLFLGVVGHEQYTDKLNPANKLDLCSLSYLMGKAPNEKCVKVSTEQGLRLTSNPSKNISLSALKSQDIKDDAKENDDTIKLAVAGLLAGSVIGATFGGIIIKSESLTYGEQPSPVKSNKVVPEA